MLYFIPWVVLMLVCVLAVPVASMIEKRKVSGGETDAGFAPEADDDEGLEPLDDDDGEGALQAGELGGEAEPAEDADDPFGTGAPDDFSAFEEEFK